MTFPIEAVDPPHDPCPKCGESISAKRSNTRGRPPKYCSRKCNEDAQNEAKVARSRERRSGRICVQCSGPLSPGASGKAITCNPECSTKYFNNLKAQKKKAASEARKANRSPCLQCKGPIPSTVNAHGRMCSKECRRKYATEQAAASGKTAAYMRMYHYNLTAERFEELLAAQNNGCAICPAEEPGGKGGWHVDHCHSSGAVRGLLCHSCNLGLGNFRDNPEFLRQAAIYLEAFQASQAEIE